MWVEPIRFPEIIITWAYGSVSMSVARARLTMTSRFRQRVAVAGTAVAGAVHTSLKGLGRFCFSCLVNRDKKRDLLERTWLGVGPLVREPTSSDVS